MAGLTRYSKKNVSKIMSLFYVATVLTPPASFAVLAGFTGENSIQVSEKSRVPVAAKPTTEIKTQALISNF